jgi:hypothetical protein
MAKLMVSPVDAILLKLHRLYGFRRILIYRYENSRDSYNTGVVDGKNITNFDLFLPINGFFDYACKFRLGV